MVTSRVHQEPPEPHSLFQAQKSLKRPHSQLRTGPGFLFRRPLIENEAETKKGLSLVETYQCALLSARRDMTQQGRNQIHDKETHLPLNLDQGCLIVGHPLKTPNQATEAVCEVVRAGGLDTPATHSLSASIALRLSTSAGTSAPASVRRAECSDAASSSQPESPSEPSEPLQQVDLATWEKQRQTKSTIGGR